MARKIKTNTFIKNDIVQNNAISSDTTQSLVSNNEKKIISLANDGTETQISLEEELKMLTNENSSLKDQLAVYINDIDALKEKINELKNDNDKLLIKVSQLSFENANLHEQLNPHKNNSVQCIEEKNNGIKSSKPIGYYKQPNIYANNGYTAWN